MLNIFNKNMQNKRKTIWLHFIFTKNNNNKKTYMYYQKWFRQSRKSPGN